MIFKQLKQGISDIYVVGNKINEINKLKLDATNITGYATALKGLTIKQAELVLSTKGLTVAQQQAILAEAGLLKTTGRLTTAELTAILVNKKRNKDQAEALLIKTGLITAEKSEATATNVVTAAKLKELVQTKALTQAEADLIASKAGVALASKKESASLLAGVGLEIKGLGSGLKSVGTGVLTLAKAHPAITAITAVIGVATVAVSIYKKKQEEAAKAIKEAYENAKTTIDDLNNTFKKNSSEIKEIAREYAELAQGVDKLTGKNISLSNEDYEEFLNLSNQIAEIFPELPRIYKENGDAIVQLSGDVDTIVGSLQNLIEAQRDLANRQIVDELPTVFDGVAAKSDIYEQQLSDLESRRDALVKSLGDVQSEEFSSNFMDGFSNKWIEISGDNLEVISQMRDDYMKILKEANIDFEELTPTYEMKDGIEVPVGFTIKINSSDEDVEKAKNTIDGKIQELASQYEADINKLNEEINTTNEKNKANWNSLSSSIFAWLSTDDSFKVMDDTMQTTVQNIVNNLDWGKLNFSSWKEAKKYIQDNILSLFNTPKGKETLADIEVMFGIQTQFNNGDITVEQYQQKLQDFLNSIESLPPETKKSILLLFGIQTNDDGTTTSDVDTMVENVKNKLQDDYDDKVGKLSLEDLKIAANLTIDSEETKKNVESELRNLEKGGSVNLLLRPQVNTSELNAKGWDAGEGTATVFSSTYSNEDGTVAINFTPIIADPNTGEYLGVMSPDELQNYAEGVIAGTREDDLNLQIGAKFEGKDAIDQAVNSAEKVHELHERYFTVDGKVLLSWDELIAKIEEVKNANKTDNSFVNALKSSTDYSDYLEKFKTLAEQGGLSAYVLSSTKEYANILETLGYSAEDAANSLKQFFGELDYGNMMDGLEGSLTPIIEAQLQFAKNGKLDFDTVQDLLDIEPKFIKQLQAVEGGYITTDAALQNLIDTKLTSFEYDNNDAVKAANKVIKSLGGEAIAYGLTTDEIIKQIKAQIALLKAKQIEANELNESIESGLNPRFINGLLGSNNLLASLYNDSQKKSDIQLHTGTNGIYSEEINQLNAILSEIKNAQTNTEKAKEIYEQLKQQVTDNFNKSSSSSKEDATDSHKQAFDDQLATLKHWLAMNQITEAQYYNTLDALNKEYFANSEEYLSEYRQYEEEVYKGLLSVQKDSLNAVNDLIDLRKEMIKDMKEDEIDALEKVIEAEKEKLDAINKSIDARKKAIELLKDEKDHDEEMAEKNKAVSDIQVQIDRLALDNSASAQKKKRELEEQLAEKKKDLADYITDYEYDKAMESLDDEADIAEQEYKLLEENLNNQIDEIQAKLDDEKLLMQTAINDINGMNNSLYEDMKTWALETTGEVWKVVDAWKAAKEALETYNATNKVPEISDTLAENNSNNTVIGNTAGTVNTSGGNTKPSYTPTTPTSSTVNSSNANNTPSTRYHTIQSVTDTMWNLAKKYYNDGSKWTKIQQANGGIDPRSLRIGQRLIIPYKNGTKKVPENQIALYDEVGEELILRANGQGKLGVLTKGSSVIPADLTENLMKWGEMNPDLLTQNLNVNIPSVNIPNFERKEFAPVVNIGDININGNMGNLTKSDLNEFRKGIVNDVYESMQKNRVKSGRY